MFADLLRRPTTKTLSLEVVGLVTGLKDVKRGASNMLANSHCEKLAAKIDKDLVREEGTVDADTREFLTLAKTHLQKLGNQPSSRHTGRFHAVRGGAIPIYRAEPAWDRAYDAFRERMVEPTSKFVGTRTPDASPTPATNI